MTIPGRDVPPGGEPRYTLTLPDEQMAYEFTSKNDLVDFIAWLVSGQPEVNLRIVNTRKKARGQYSRKIPAVR